MKSKIAEKKEYLLFILLLGITLLNLILSGLAISFPSLSIKIVFLNTFIISFALSFVYLYQRYYGSFVGTKGTRVNLLRIFAVSFFMPIFIPLMLIAFFLWEIIGLNKLFIRQNNLPVPLNHKFLKITAFFYSYKMQREIFEPIIADWEEEHFEALFGKEIWKARWINVRYTYAFLAAMWRKNPIGDLIEFVSKLAK